MPALNLLLCKETPPDRGCFSLYIHSARGGLFHQGSVVHHSIVESEATCKVVGFKAIAHQNTGGDIAAQAALTDHIDRLFWIQFRNAIS